METFIPQNLDPILEVIKRVRLLKKPNMHNKDCQEIERRFYDQDWMSQLEIYELWLDVDNRYSRSCLYRCLNTGYWELLQKLIFEKHSERAVSIAERIKEYSIRHIRFQPIAYFVTIYMSIDIVRKYRKTLARYLEMAYIALAFRIGGDADFRIDKDMLVPRLAYYSICKKFNIKTSDEEALADFKQYIKWEGQYLSLDTIQDEYQTFFDLSLLNNRVISEWYSDIKILGLNKMVKAFERFNTMLQNQIVIIFNQDESCIDFPGMPKERQFKYWDKLRQLAYNEIINQENPEELMSNFISENPSFSQFANQFDLQIYNPLSLD